MYMDRVPACLCYLKYAVYCPWAGTDFMLASICMSQRQVFTFRAVHRKFSLSIPKCHIISEILSLLVAIPRLTHLKGA